MRRITGVAPWDVAGDRRIWSMRDDTCAKSGTRFLTVAAAAVELDVSSKHIRRMIARGDLPVYRFRRAVRIARVDLEQFIRESQS
jgi:excisionase family DNA binding protein